MKKRGGRDINLTPTSSIGEIGKRKGEKFLFSQGKKTLGEKGKETERKKGGESPLYP